MSKFVYICFIGEDYESDEIVVVLDSEEKAKRWEEEQTKEFEAHKNYRSYASYYVMEVQ